MGFDGESPDPYPESPGAEMHEFADIPPPPPPRFAEDGSDGDTDPGMENGYGEPPPSFPSDPAYGEPETF